MLGAYAALIGQTPTNMDYFSTVAKKTTSVAATDWEKFHNSAQKSSIKYRTPVRNVCRLYKLLLHASVVLEKRYFLIVFML